jgi:hypothetical protein
MTQTTEIEQVVTEPTTRPEYREPGDDEKFSHWVDKDDLMRGTVEGVAVRALCGKMWVPTRDASKFPVCPECKEVWENLPHD